MLKITPFMWFDGQAEEAAKFYMSSLRTQRFLALPAIRRDRRGPREL